MQSEPIELDMATPISTPNTPEHPAQEEVSILGKRTASDEATGSPKKVKLSTGLRVDGRFRTVFDAPDADLTKRPVISSNPPHPYFYKLTDDRIKFREEIERRERIPVGQPQARKFKTGEGFEPVEILFSRANMFFAQGKHKDLPKKSTVRSCYPSAKLLIKHLTQAGFAIKNPDFRGKHERKELHKWLYGDNWKAIYNLDAKGLDNETELAMDPLAAKPKSPEPSSSPDVPETVTSRRAKRQRRVAAKPLYTPDEPEEGDFADDFANEEEEKKECKEGESEEEELDSDEEGETCEEGYVVDGFIMKDDEDEESSGEEEEEDEAEWDEEAATDDEEEEESDVELDEDSDDDMESDSDDDELL